MKLHKSYIFRLLLALIIVSVAITVSTVVMVVFLPESLFFIPLVVGVFMAAVSILAIVLFSYFSHIRVLRKIITSYKKVVEGEYVKIKKASSLDKDLLDILTALNNIAYEFEILEEKRKSFVSNVSHELRSPLTSMQGFLQAILDKTIDSADHGKYLKIVFRETQRLTQLINSMLDLSKMESGKNPIVFERFELTTVLKQVIERFQPYLIKKGMEIMPEFVRELCYVYADKEKVVQVLINLIDNAIKYSGQSSKILVTTHIHSKKVFVSVKDSGIGISKKDQPFVWDRFYMTDKAHTATDTKGTGLGLSIVKKILDDHGEVIWLESRKNIGSTFIFTLQLFDSAKHKLEPIKSKLKDDPLLAKDIKI